MSDAGRLRRDSGESVRPGGLGNARYLFRNWPGIARRVRAARRVAIFTDFDGVLVRIQPRPSSVRLPEVRRRLLARLARHPRISLWIVSGRRLADIRRRAGRVGARLAGLHGWEREDTPPPAAAGRLALRRAGQLLRERLRGLRGIWVEDKEWALAVHYRAAAGARVRLARRVLREVMWPFAPALRLMQGKMVWEVVPRETESRGQAVRNLLREEPLGSLPVYMGDDFSDESAFHALRRGITLHVGSTRTTRAQYYLHNPEEVMTFLERLEEEVS